ncbi:MAG: type IV pilin protein [Desulfomonilaceae bacterium]
MNLRKDQSGFALFEMVSAIVIIAILSVIYFLMIDSYRERRMSEQAAKALMLAARAQEEFFAREHRYFDAEVSSKSKDSNLNFPGGTKTNVVVPMGVTLSLKTKGPERAAFSGESYYGGSKIIHRYDSEAGRITTHQRN